MLKSNASGLAALNKKRAQRLKHELQRVGAQTKPALVDRGKELSSGTFNKQRQQGAAFLRGYGVYSVISPAPPTDPAIINKGAGNVYSGWFARARISRDLSLSVSVGNRAREFNFLMPAGKQGPRSAMIARPVIVRIQEMEHAAFFARLRRANSRALKA